MKGYRARYTDIATGIDTLTSYQSTMVRIHQACFDLVEQGIASKDSIVIMDDRGTTYTVDAMEKILADNEVEFPKVPEA